MVDRSVRGIGFVGGGAVEDTMNSAGATRHCYSNFLFWQLNSALYTVHLRMFDDDQAGWGTDVVSTGDVVKDTIRKEQIIKCVQFMSTLALIAYTNQGYCRFSR